MNTAYDLLLRRDLDGTVEEHGFIIPWSSSDPVQVLRSRPDVNSGSSETSSVGGRLSSRDAPPPYPVEYSNWKGGCGQRSLDWEDSVAKAFWDSRSIDVRKRGNMELGPYRTFFDDPDIIGPCIEALGTIWCGFKPNNVVVVPAQTFPFAAGLNAICVLDTGEGGVTREPPYDEYDWLVNTGYHLPGVVAPLDGFTLRVGDVFTFTDGTTFTITRVINSWNYIGRSTAVAYRQVADESHFMPAGSITRPSYQTIGNSGSLRYLNDDLQWVPIERDNDDLLYCKALCTDGGRVYAAFGDYVVDGDVGYVMSGIAGETWSETPSETNFYAGTPNITSLVYSGGYIYGAQTRYSGGGDEKTAAGAWAFSSGAWTFGTISAAGGVYPRTKDKGLAAVGNDVYWVTAGEDQGWVYKLQRGGSVPFSLVDTLPHDFNPTCVISHLGFPYIGGYVNTGTTFLNNPENTRYNGAVYTIIDGTASVLTTIGLDADADYRVCGMTGNERFLHIITQDDLWTWDLQEGSLHETMPILGGTATVQGDDGIDWQGEGYDYQVSTESVSSNQNDNDTNARPPAADGWVTYQQDNANWVRTVTSDKWLWMRCDNNHYAYIRRYDADLVGRATMEFKYKHPENEGGECQLADNERLVRVKVKGVMKKQTKNNKVTWTRDGSYVYLGYQSDSASGSTEADITQWKRSAKLSDDEHTVRVVLNDVGASVYIDGALALQTDRASLKLIDGTFGEGNGQQVSMFTGWYHDPQKGNTQREKIKLKYFKYSAEGSYTPGYSSVTDTVVLGSFCCKNGTFYIPAPGKGWQIADPTTVAGSGWLETSESSYKMPSIMKTFTSVEIDLPVSDDFIGAVNSNQRILTTLYIDGQPVNLEPIVGPQGNATHFVLPVTGALTKGYKVAVRVTLEDGEWDAEGVTFTPTVTRSAIDRLRLSCITVKFFITAGARQYQIKLDCTAPEVRDTIPRSYDEDPQTVIDWLFDQCGEILEAEMVGREMRVHLDEVVLKQTTPDKRGYNGIRGYPVITMTEVEDSNVASG